MFLSNYFFVFLNHISTNFDISAKNNDFSNLVVYPKLLGIETWNFYQLISSTTNFWTRCSFQHTYFINISLFIDI